MDPNLNPYQSPNYEQPASRSLFSRLGEFFFGSPSQLKRLLRGEPIIQYGVMFFIDTENESTIYAAVPIYKVTDKLVDLAVQEAVRELNKLVAEHEELQQGFSERKLSIGIVATYSDYLTPIQTRIISNWKY